ncbi:MAG: hypothetical protein HKO57_15445, partial [Akkermansiaceae bacterium]|nr:hypothetical protein [Akkermansiaceae bacterium]
REIRFAEAATPLIDRELVAFRAKPDFRLAELTGLKAVDVTETTFPGKWRGLPVYEWPTDTPIVLVEKMRGMGLQRPEGLRIRRGFWLDEDGRGLTYRDTVTGQMQQIWRLDTAKGQELGAVRVDGAGQLVTANPATGDHGVEIRTRNLTLEAIGRIPDADDIPATGWQSDADSLAATLNLPPGWRAFAMFGADHVDGDWLTAWSLLDLFLLLIFGMAVVRLWGVPAGVVAFLAFGLAFHEPGAPRLTWLFLLIPLGLLRVVRHDTARKWLRWWKWFAVALLLLNLIPFLAIQLQSAIYPQLERPGVNYTQRGMFPGLGFAYRESIGAARRAYQTDALLRKEMAPQTTKGAQQQRQSKFQSKNLLYEPKARIQTGPAEPEWSWNRVNLRWDGPVTAGQEIRPILISRGAHRLLTVARVALLVLLGFVLLGAKRVPSMFRRRGAGAAALLAAMLAGLPGDLSAQEIPGDAMLQKLRERLLEAPDAFPRAAEIATVAMKLDGNRVLMECEVHTVVEAAVPLPGKLPDWSPVKVTTNREQSAVVARKDGYLWTVLPAGVHRVVVESLLPEVPDWQWTFLLKPRRVTIEAPGWTVTGVRRNGVPEDQVFLARERAADPAAAAYDRKDFNAIVAVDRHLETGLTWQVNNQVTRLSPPGKAVSIKVPLLAGERVLTSNVVVEDGHIEVKLGAGQAGFQWVSELPVGTDITLTAPDTDQWIERWHLVSSPVWNVTRDGLAPIFDADQEDLVPVWNPWPGESVTLAFDRPEAVTGQTITVQRVKHETSLGRRQRTAELKVELESSLGSDFRLGLDPAAEVSSIKVGGQAIPVRRDDGALIIPVQPGKQEVAVAWRTGDPMNLAESAGTVTLPVEAANITTVLEVPESRWVLWASGPRRGPAVRFWSILAFAVLAAWILGGLALSPLKRIEWVLLAIGLTQVHVAAALIVVLWLFALARRGKRDPAAQSWWKFNIKQIVLVLLTLIALGILIVAVGAGLLGNPEMFIVGNGSSQTYLQWFDPRTGTELPEPFILSVSVWFYRLAMLFWALWLAAALLRWLAKGWKQFSSGGAWMRKPKVITPPEIPGQA